MLLGLKEFFVRVCIHKTFKCRVVSDLDFDEPAIGLSPAANLLWLAGQLVVDSDNITRTGGVHVGSSLDTLDRAHRLCGRKLLALLRKIDEYNVAKLFSSELSDANSALLRNQLRISYLGCIVVTNPLVTLAETGGNCEQSDSE